MTLRGQPAAYWAGGFRVTDEFNPAARVLLQLHPLAFVAAALVSALLIVLLTLSLSRALAVPLAFVVTFGHAFAAAAWMVHGGVTLAGALGALMTLLVAERLVAWSGRVTGGMAGIPPALS